MTQVNNNDSLGDSIISNELTNISTDLLEVGLDTFLEDGVLKEIPIIGTFLGLAKVGIGIRDKIFAKKVLKFLFQLKDIPTADRVKFLNDLDTKNEYSTKVGETIIVILDKLDDMKKAEMIGKLFACLIKGKIDYKMFVRLSMIIEKCFLPDLKNLRLLYNGEKQQVNEFDKQQLSNLSLLMVLPPKSTVGDPMFNPHLDPMFNSSLDPMFGNRTEIEYKISEYGRLIVELLLINK